MLRISNIKIRTNESNNTLFDMVMKKYKIRKEDVLDWHISKKSIDARRKDDVYINYAIDIKVTDESKYPHFNKVKEHVLPDTKVHYQSHNKPIIIGAGPAGLFSALTLVEQGFKPIIIEQGQCIEERKETIDKFLKEGKLNSFSNVQFGEGGAGTFSDGKLTTGINSPYCKKVLQEFVKFGAPEEILYLSKPHIGTDNLIQIMKQIRTYIIQKGGTFLFDTKVIDFGIENSCIQSVTTKNVKTNEEKILACDRVILAIGHSSKDTFETLYHLGFSMEQKNFSVGVRIEHLQIMINEAQYGKHTRLSLPPAEYKFAYHGPDGRSCYTFCMCPGGVVMASSSNYNTVVTNGMSYYARDGKNANAALLVNITPDDFDDDSPLTGVHFQKQLEEKAFLLGGSNYYAPIQRVEDFLENRKTTSLGHVKPTYTPGVTFSNLNDILPDFVAKTLKEGILQFDKKLKGFAHPDSILTGLETRSSSPVRILRNELLTSNILGVYPCGEGAGYAGGIMSAAVDGIKCAIALMEHK